MCWCTGFCSDTTGGGGLSRFWRGGAVAEEKVAEGLLVVDKSQLFRMNPGIDPDKQYPQSILKV